MPYRDPEDHKAHGRLYYAENREKLLAYGREYRNRHRKPPKAVRFLNERDRADHLYATSRACGNRATARSRGAAIDPEFTNAMLAGIFRDNAGCDWCGTPVPSMHDRMIDHRIAIYFGGTHTASNIQILCKTCEKKKSSAERSMAQKLAKRVTTQADFVLAA